MIEADVERYADPRSFAREVNLPLLGTSRLGPIPSGAGISTLLDTKAPPELASVVDGLAETRQSLTLRSLLLAGFADDSECFAAGLALAREWSSRGLKVAVVDLDFWHPTVVRPRPHPNEGLVDVLEYGCSFRRVAWEIVADALWLIGPGSYPPEEGRLVDHPDWERAARGFAAHVDVTLFVAPLLQRRGFVGRLSKRMDGALIAASVERVGRAELRDAFLELWGSDAPIIGCVGIEPTAPVKAAKKAESAPSVVSAPATSRALGNPVDTGVPRPIATREHIAERRGRTIVPVGSIRGRDVTSRTDARDDADLTAILNREVRTGKPTLRPRRRSRRVLYAGMAVGLSVAASIVAVLTHQPRLPAVEETLPSGTEQVLPAIPDHLITPEPEQATTAGATETGSPIQDAPALSPAPTPRAGGAPPALISLTPSAEGIPPSISTPDLPFRVHVASFKSEEKVQGIVRELRLRGADAWYEPATDAPNYFRVFVGHFATEAEARAHAQWLLANGWVDRAQAYPSTPR